ncbi:MAG: DUF1207 domain-containing protein [Flavobacteriales bacterium]|nr:DUF1207 domain-containing protein [Flavobacteriales bacterium]
MKKYGFLFLIFVVATPLFSQSYWMGNRLTNSSIYLDPTEIQVSGSMTSLLKKNALENQYIPFSFGIAQAIYSKKIEEHKAWDIIGELGSFTQFEWKKVEGIQQRNLINIDYKIAFSFVKQLNETSTYRIRFFHVSSHLGDDYIIRNQIISYTKNKVNYEQLDLSYFKRFSPYHLAYGGIGSVVRPNSIRLPLSFYLGWQKEFKKENSNWAWSLGANLKSFQETDFNLNTKLAAGIAYYTASKQEPIRIVLEHYRGHLPYSQFERTRTEWLGIGLYFYI